MKRQKVGVRMVDGGTSLIPGIVLDGTEEGLAVTRAVSTSGNTVKGYWGVTHCESGQSIGPPFCSFRMAVEIARTLGPLTDWTRSGEELLADAVLNGRVGMVFGYLE